MFRTNDVSQFTFPGSLPVMRLRPSTRARDGDLIAARLGTHLYIRLVTHLGAVLSLATGLSGEREIFLGPTDDYSVLGVVVVVIRATRLRDED